MATRMSDIIVGSRNESWFREFTDIMEAMDNSLDKEIELFISQRFRS